MNMNLRQIELGHDEFRFLSEDDVADMLWQAILDAVKIRVHDGPSIFLSGGLDTGLIAAACVELGYHPDAYTVAFGEESLNYINARRTANLLDLRHTIFTMRRNQATILQEELDTVFGKSFILSGAEQIYFAYESINGDTHAVLGGHAGDELFGGYPWQYLLEEDLIRAKMNLLIHTNLMPLLFVEQRIAEGFGIELRTPYLDPLVIAIAERIPLKMLYDKTADMSHGYGGKKLMRKIAKGRLPDEVVNDKKRGFVTPWYMREKYGEENA